LSEGRRTGEGSQQGEECDRPPPIWQFEEFSVVHAS
jgi:hypothetical protein